MNGIFARFGSTHSDACPTNRGFDTAVLHHSFVEADIEISSTVILSPLLNQEWHLSVTDEKMCT